MTIHICYFARFREKLACNQEQYDYIDNLQVEQLLQQLAARGGAWQALFDCPKGVLVAVNQQMAQLSTVINDGDEVAFFPPVTGG